MAFEIKFQNKSLKADRNATLKGMDKSEVNLLRVVCNEVLHIAEHRNWTGLHVVLSHVQGRKVLFSTLMAIVSATSDGVNMKENEDGVFGITLDKNVTINDDTMRLVVKARDGGVVGVFNTALLTSIGIGAVPVPAAWEIVKAAASFYAKAIKAGHTENDIIKAFTLASNDANPDKKVDGDTDALPTDAPVVEDKPAFETGGLSAVG